MILYKHLVHNEFASDSVYADVGCSQVSREIIASIVKPRHSVHFNPSDAIIVTFHTMENKAVQG